MTNTISTSIKYATVHLYETPIDLVWTDDKCLVSIESVCNLVSYLAKDETAVEFGMIPSLFRDFEISDGKDARQGMMDGSKAVKVFGDYYEKAAKIRDAFIDMTSSDLLSDLHGIKAGETFLKYSEICDKVSFAAGRLLTLQMFFEVAPRSYDSFKREEENREIILDTLDEIERNVRDDDSTLEEMREMYATKLHCERRAIDDLNARENETSDDTYAVDALHSVAWSYERAIYALERFDNKTDVISYIRSCWVDISCHGELVNVTVS